MAWMGAGFSVKALLEEGAVPLIELQL